MEIRIKKSGTRSRYVFIRTNGWEKLTFGKMFAISQQIWWLIWGRELEIRDYKTFEAENVKFIADYVGDINPDFRKEKNIR